MRTKQNTDELLTAETEPCVRRILEVFDDIASGHELDHKHPAWGDSAQDHLDDVLIFSGCENCAETFNQFYQHIVPMGLPVIFQFKFVSPISFLTFLVARRAKLSLYRLKHRQFGQDELQRIADAVSELASVKFKIYDCRRVSGDLKLDGGESLVLISM